MTRAKKKWYVILPLIVMSISFGLFSLHLEAQESGFSSLKNTISGLVAKKPGNSVVGVAVVDIRTGETIYTYNANQALNPASNAKIVTAAGALKLLGPEFTFNTELYGKVSTRNVQGSLYLKGYADPTLRTADLWALARELKANGVRRIGGGIIVDDSYFDENNMPFAFDEQPDEDNKFRTPVGAVSLNHNALGIQIRPGATAMTKALVDMDPPEYAMVVNDSLTTASGAYNPKISSTPYEDRTKIRVWGQVPLGATPTWYYRRIDNPSLFTGYALKGVLKELGISVGGDVRTGAIPSGTPLIARHSSEALSSVLWETGKMSNNFVTEMVLKTIGAESAPGPGTWEGATEAVAKQLTAWGVKKGTYKYRNGSGLFSANAFSANHFCAVLRAAYLDTTIRPEFLSQLATGGADGTIKSRYQHSSTKRYVRAKTGTLDSVSALSGYVLDETGQHPIAFSILVNNASGYVAAARKYQEDIVTAIARYLNN
ncbi:MAG: D-alanyl-D-alanine carboxypeptidase/D-alanyl-D-alanine-endopeptidase [Deltaproteobacteria bacterium]|nr:D-alanyl-D-alanine carboxypeptidase/D-alanyl-D-alanine-endopeptidase [Deltaproteobacteria bacterium]MBN2674014.1 D-alanyl-D-alanine carboxypeptidase/D-alanyl-D-alanine-endopeptidase [Deltaproteobacteria bacterium]